MTKTIITRILKLLVCLLMLTVISLRKDGRILGHDIKASGKEKADTSVIAVENGVIVVNTTALSENIIGYAGPIPVKLFVLEGNIDSIAVLKNSETAGFLRRATSNILPLYKGKSVEQARSMQVDAVTGCTYSSNALIANIELALSRVPGDTSELLQGKALEAKALVKLAIVLIVSLMAAILPFFIKNRTYRTVQLVLNVAVLGLYSATSVGYTPVVGAISNGIAPMNIALGVLLVIAFLYPLFGKRGHYCNWACPFGSAQELMGRCSRRKIRIGGKTVKWLGLAQKVLWAVLMVLAWSGIFLDWMDWELFSAFAWESAQWTIIAFAAVVLVLSVFINRPYCRFVCPTGVILKNL